jgi:hypothetical protein
MRKREEDKFSAHAVLFMRVDQKKKTLKLARAQSSTMSAMYRDWIDSLPWPKDEPRGI